MVKVRMRMKPLNQTKSTSYPTRQQWCCEEMFILHPAFTHSSHETFCALAPPCE